MSTEPDLKGLAAAARLAKHAKYWREDGNPPAYDQSMLGMFQMADDVLALIAERDALRKAVEIIARDGHGLQGLVEEEASADEIGAYWRKEAQRRQSIARAALTEAELARLQSENTRLLGEDQGLAQDVIALAEHLREMHDFTDGPCPTEGLCGASVCDACGCVKDKADRARSALLPIGGGEKQGSSVAESASEGLRPFASDSSCQSEGGR